LAKRGRAERKRCVRNPEKLDSTLKQNTLTNIGALTSRAKQDKILRLEPNGAPFWKYTPSTRVIEKDPHVTKIVKRAGDERLPMDKIHPPTAAHTAHIAQSQSVDDISCTRYEKMQNRLEKKLAVYKMCSETFFKSKNAVAEEALPNQDDGIDDDGLSQCSIA